MNRDPDSPSTGLALFRAAWMLLWWHFCSFPPTKLLLLHCEPLSAGWTLRNPERGWAGEAEVVSIGTTADMKLYCCVSLNVRFLSASKTFSAGTECPAGKKEGGKVWVWAICTADVIVWTNFLVLIKPVNLRDMKWQPFPLHADVTRWGGKGIRSWNCRSKFWGQHCLSLQESQIILPWFYVLTCMYIWTCVSWQFWKHSLHMKVKPATMCLALLIVPSDRSCSRMGRLQTWGQAKAKAELLILF